MLPLGRSQVELIEQRHAVVDRQAAQLRAVEARQDDARRQFAREELDERRIVAGAAPRIELVAHVRLGGGGARSER